jgi:hypothetical protein
VVHHPPLGLSGVAGKAEVARIVDPGHPCLLGGEGGIYLGPSSEA